MFGLPHRGQCQLLLRAWSCGESVWKLNLRSVLKSLSTGQSAVTAIGKGVTKRLQAFRVWRELQVLAILAWTLEFQWSLISPCCVVASWKVDSRGELWHILSLGVGLEASFGWCSFLSSFCLQFSAWKTNCGQFLSHMQNSNLWHSNAFKAWYP